MKKVLFLLISIFLFNTQVLALEEEEVTLVDNNISVINCDDYKSIWLSVDGKVKIVRMLAYDKDNGKLNNEIDNYICESLKNANKIEIETDELSKTTDEYNREFVWIYVDSVLLQKDLIEKGYGQVNNVSDDYKYLDTLCDVQKKAIIKKRGIWNYSNIKEKYCNSGVAIKNDKLKEKENKKKESNKNKKNLYYILVINSGVILLLFLLRGMRICKRIN